MILPHNHVYATCYIRNLTRKCMYILQISGQREPGSFDMVSSNNPRIRLLRPFSGRMGNATSGLQDLWRQQNLISEGKKIDNFYFFVNTSEQHLPTASFVVQQQWQKGVVSHSCCPALQSEKSGVHDQHCGTDSQPATQVIWPSGQHIWVNE